jgi:ribosome-associated protein
VDYVKEVGGELPLAPSKSQVKRELHALQALAERLVSLPRAELERLRLSEATWAAIEETSRIKDLRARRRHFKRIAKLLAREDMKAVDALMHEREETARQAAAHHHQLERWRERLIDEGDQALTAFLTEHPGADSQRLRTLVRAARRGREQGKPDAARKLFRILREEVERTDSEARAE